MTHKLKTVAELARDTVFTEGALRWHVFNQANNGLQACGAIIKLGRRVYIDVDRFEAWLASHQTNAQQPQA